MTTVTHQTSDELRPLLRRHGIAMILAGAALAFLLPFGTVSCDGEVVHFTGVELATRHVAPDPDASSSRSERLNEEVESEAGTFALMALVFVAFGAGSVTWRGLGGGFAVAALVSLVLLLLSAAVSFADVSILLGFWLALGCVVAATILRARARWSARRRRKQDGVIVPRPLFGDWLRRHAPSWALGAGGVAVIVVLEAATTRGS